MEIHGNTLCGMIPTPKQVPYASHSFSVLLQGYLLKMTTCVAFAFIVVNISLNIRKSEYHYNPFLVMLYNDNSVSNHLHTRKPKTRGRGYICSHCLYQQDSHKVVASVISGVVFVISIS